MCLGTTAGYAKVVDCGDAACVAKSLATLARCAHELDRHHVIRRYWRLKGFNPHATPKQLALVRGAKALA